MYIIVDKRPERAFKNGRICLNMYNKLVNYLKGVRAELSFVNWPTKKQTINYTMLVIGVSLFVSLLLGFFDKIFTFLLQVFVF